MPGPLAPTSIEEYIASSPPEVRPILEQIRATVRKAAPQAEERISYRMPAFFQNGVLIYFAAFKNHIGLYPPVPGDDALMEETARYRGEKGNLRLPLDEPIPLDLIRRIVEFRLEERATAASSKKASPRKPRNRKA